MIHEFKLLLNLLALCIAFAMPCQAAFGSMCSQCAAACNCIAEAKAGDSSSSSITCCAGCDCCGEGLENEHKCHGLDGQPCICLCHQAPSSTLPRLTRAASSDVKLIKVYFATCIWKPRQAIDALPGVAVTSTCALFLSQQDACILFCRLVI